MLLGYLVALPKVLEEITHAQGRRRPPEAQLPFDWLSDDTGGETFYVGRGRLPLTCFTMCNIAYDFVTKLDFVYGPLMSLPLLFKECGTGRSV